ncbi:MAG: lytic transglycosylase domain-containing protein [Acidobacteriota bacterium]
MSVFTRAPSSAARRALGGLLALAFALAGAGPAAGELVILSDGDFLQVDDFRIVERKIELDLPSGGLLVLPITRVSRILDDEIVPRDERQETAEPPGFELRWAGQPVPSVPYGEAIHAAAERHGLNPALVAEVVRAESSFRAEVVSHKGAQGLMQLMPATAERFGLSGGQVFEPENNLEAGCRYLRWLADHFEDDLTKVLASYNAGEGAVARYGGVPPYRETRRYVAKILKALGVETQPG